MDGLHASRRDHHWQRNILAHNGSRQVSLFYRTHDVRREPELAEGVDIVGDRDPLLTGGDERSLDRLGQPLARPLLGNRDRLEPGFSCHD